MNLFNIVLLFGLASVALSEVIPVQNGGFEADTVPANVNRINVIPQGWDITTPEDADKIFVRREGRLAFVNDPDRGGTNTMIVRAETVVYQVLQATFEEGFRYTLSADIGYRRSGVDFRDVEVQLRDEDDNILDLFHVNETVLPIGNIERFSVSADILASSSSSGRKIQVAFQVFDKLVGPAIDNVEVEREPIPTTTTTTTSTTTTSTSTTSTTTEFIVPVCTGFNDNGVKCISNCKFGVCLFSHCFVRNDAENAC